MAKNVILTGIRANNDLHIGNYFGALLPMVEMAKSRSKDYEVNLMLADLHSFTTPIDHSKLQDQIKQSLRIYIAAGIPLDNSNVRIFRQSFVPAHSELTWILDCFTGMGELKRMTQFKDKTSKLSEDRVNLGLFNYPVLMACDVLIYGAQYVPVGDDQTQHLEFTRDIAERMNKRFGDLFIVPEPVRKQHEFFGKDQGLRIRDLVEPDKKMSKSDESSRGVIFLSDSPEEAAKKIMGATTDNEASVGNPDFATRPGVANLLQIYDLLVPDHQDVSRMNYKEFKQLVSLAVKDFLTSFQSRVDDVDDKEILSKLEHDEAQMNKIAEQTLTRVQKAVGLR